MTVLRDTLVLQCYMGSARDMWPLTGYCDAVVLQYYKGSDTWPVMVRHDTGVYEVLRAPRAYYLDPH